MYTCSLGSYYIDLLTPSSSNLRHIIPSHHIGDDYLSVPQTTLGYFVLNGCVWATSIRIRQVRQSNPISIAIAIIYIYIYIYIWALSSRMELWSVTVFWKDCRATAAGDCLTAGSAAWHCIRGHSWLQYEFVTRHNALPRHDWNVVDPRRGQVFIG